jgi:hypothetical protein
MSSKTDEIKLHEDSNLLKLKSSSSSWWGYSNITYLLVMMFVLFIAVCIIEWQFNKMQKQVDRLRLTMIRELDHTKHKVVV